MNNISNKYFLLSGHQILCVAQSHLNDWDRQNVVMTGSSDGVVRMWSLDYVEVAEDSLGTPDLAHLDTLTVDPDTDPGLHQPPAVSSITELAKKMSVSVSGDCLTSLREVVTRHKQQEAAEVSADLSSDTEDCEAEDLEPDTLTSRPEDMVDGCSPLPADTPAAAVTDTPAATASADSPAVAAAEALPAASSDSSFVVVHSPVHGPGPAMKPGDGYTWCRQVGPQIFLGICHKYF